MHPVTADPSAAHPAAHPAAPALATPPGALLPLAGEIVVSGEVSADGGEDILVTRRVIGRLAQSKPFARETHRALSG